LEHAVKTCLVVDDSRVIRKVARRVLEDIGFEIAEAADGMEAWRGVAPPCPTPCCWTGTCR
jgi:CheY-like chemotaxis protein